MLDYVRHSTEGYDPPSEDGVSKISKEDGAILTKLLQLLVTADVEQEIIEVVSCWKQIPDEDVLERLQSSEERLEGGQRPSYFLDVNGLNLSAGNIFSISKREGYNSKKNIPEYYIVFNETESPNILNGNVKLTFDDWSERDACLLDMKVSLSVFTSIRFL